jgi:hypothetical protein
MDTVRRQGILPCLFFEMLESINFHPYLIGKRMPSFWDDEVVHPRLFYKILVLGLKLAF